MTQDAFTPDARFFNEDGSINYREALAAAQAAKAETAREMMMPQPKPAKPALSARIATMFRPAGATA